MDKEDADEMVNVNNVVARVDKVRIKGLGRTKDDIVINSLNGIFNATNFQELIEKSIETRLNLEKLGCFKNIGIYIDTSSGPGSTPNYGYDVTFEVKELRRITGRINTTIENNHGSLGIEFQSPNLLGRGECLQAEGKYVYTEMKAFNLSFVKPLWYCNGLFSTSAFKNLSDNSAAGYRLMEHGVSVDLSFLYSGHIKHNLTWEGVIRNLATLGKDVPFSIREHSGYSLKSAFRNVLSIDTRNSIILPTEGNLFQLKSEFAGIGGDIGFVKNEIMSQFNVPLFNDISFQNSFAAGIINVVNKDKRVTIADNFFLGGPLTLRGFHLNNVGPKVDGYATGGSLYFLNALHLYTPLLHRPKKGSFGDSFRIHLFCNIGNITNVSSDINECLERLSRNFRLTYGFGILYRFRQLARFELNYCIPMFHQGDDKLVDGVQFGFGVHFM